MSIRSILVILIAGTLSACTSNKLVSVSSNISGNCSSLWLEFRIKNRADKEILIPALSLPWVDIKGVELHVDSGGRVFNLHEAEHDLSDVRDLSVVSLPENDQLRGKSLLSALWDFEECRIRGCTLQWTTHIFAEDMKKLGEFSGKHVIHCDHE